MHFHSWMIRQTSGVRFGNLSKCHLSERVEELFTVPSLDSSLRKITLPCTWHLGGRDGNDNIWRWEELQSGGVYRPAVSFTVFLCI